METLEKTITERTIKIARTRTGAPCLWESYSEFDNGLVRSTIITDKDGNIKKSIFVKNAKNKQALVPIEPGDVIVKVFRDNIGIAISLLEIKDISSLKNEAQILPIYRKSSEETSTKYPLGFSTAIGLASLKLEDSNKICCELIEKTLKI
jgi:hypothetical protein